MHLATLVDSDLPGWSRTGFSEEDRAARAWLLALMRDAGLDAYSDAAGNLIGSIEGTNPTAPAIVIGSHSDTVPGGGRFDGIVGILGAIEVVRMLRAANVRLRRTLRVVDFANEEGNPQGVKLVGSRAIAGSLDRAALEAVDAAGVTLAALMTGAGHSPELLSGARWRPGDIDAYLELHIEQGPVLTEAGAHIGVVTSICGISTFALDVAGRRDHGGTMPMSTRSDAMCCAADAVLSVQQIASARAEAVGTVGAVTTPSPLTNTISEAARVTGEFRSPSAAGLAELRAEFSATTAVRDRRHRTRSRLQWLHTDAPTPMDTGLSAIVVGAAEAAGERPLRLYSGATHDGVAMSEIAPSAMIFIPSRDGRSHCPEEWTELADIGRGISVLYGSVIAVDAR
nr:M20 family metallo-hydrolase [Leucobacter luti]